MHRTFKDHMYEGYVEEVQLAFENDDDGPVDTFQHTA
jgi:hypothetical protein